MYKIYISLICITTPFLYVFNCLNVHVCIYIYACVCFLFFSLEKGETRILFILHTFYYLLYFGCILSNAHLFFFATLSQNLTNSSVFPLKSSLNPEHCSSRGTYVPEARMFTTRLLGARNFSEYSARSRVVNKKGSRKFRVPGGGTTVRDRNVNCTRDFGWCLLRESEESVDSVSPAHKFLPRFPPLSLSLYRCKKIPRENEITSPTKAAKMLNSPGTIRPSN